MLPERFYNPFGYRKRALAEAEFINIPALFNRLIAFFVNGQRRRGRQAPDFEISIYCKGMFLGVQRKNLFSTQIYASMLAYLALRSIKSRRGGTSSPISMEKIRSASVALSMVTWRRVRNSGFIVVSHNCSAFISPRPL